MISTQTTIKEIAQYHPLFETVLDRYALRFSDQQMPIGVACVEAEIETDFLIEVLRVFEAPQTFDAKTLQRFPIPVILDYLYKTHAWYQEKRLGEIELSVARLAEVYRAEHPLLSLLRTFFQRYKVQIAEHIADEERNLFPVATNIWDAAEKGVAFNEPFDPDAFMHAHGEDELDVPLKEIQALVERRHPEVKNLFPYNVLNWQLNALQQDLWIHERVEEEVLIPRMSEMLGAMKK